MGSLEIPSGKRRNLGPGIYWKPDAGRTFNPLFDKLSELANKPEPESEGETHSVSAEYGKGDRPPEEPEKEPQKPKQGFLEKQLKKNEEIAKKRNEVLENLGIKSEEAPKEVHPAEKTKEEIPVDQIGDFARGVALTREINLARLEPEQKEFYEKYRSKIDPLVERLRPIGESLFRNRTKEANSEENADAEKHKRWEVLPDDRKTDFIVNNIIDGNQDWRPWELEFRKNNNEVIEEKLKKAQEKETWEKTPSQEKVESVRRKNVEKIAGKIISGDELTEKENEAYEKYKAEIKSIIKGENKAETNERVIRRTIEKGKERATLATEGLDPRVQEITSKMNMDLNRLYRHSSGFFKLSPDQQIYVLEKTRQRINLDASLEAKKLIEDKLNRKTKFLSAEWFKKKGLSFNKDRAESKTKAEIMESIIGDGASDYLEDIKAMTDHVRELGLPLKYENGRLEIQYVDPSFFSEGMEYEKRLSKGEKVSDYVKRFNESATKLSEIPDEWRLSKFTWNKKRYNEANREYERRKSILFGAVVEKYKKEFPDEKQAEAAAMDWMNGLDTKIRMNQILSEYPKLDDENKTSIVPNIGAVVPDKSWWSSFGTGSVAGYVGRFLTRRTYGLEGAAIFGGVLSATLAGRRKWLEYTDKEKKKRYGEAGIEEKGIKRYLDAGAQVEKMVGLLERLQTETDIEKKNKLAMTIRNRVGAIDMRIKEGRVNYGSKEARLSNKLKLIQLISVANAEIFNLGTYKDVPEVQDFYARLGQFQKDKMKRREKIGGIAWASGRAALLSASGAAAGFLITDAIREIGSSQSYLDRLKEIFGKDYGEGDWNDVQPGFQPTVPPAGLNHIETSNINISPKPSGIPIFNQEVAVDQRGASAAIEKLKQGIAEKYIDQEVPEKLRHFMETPTDTLTREYGFIANGDSAIIQKGSTLGLENGELVYTNPKGVEKVLDIDHRYEGTFAKPETAPIRPEENIISRETPPEVMDTVRTPVAPMDLPEHQPLSYSPESSYDVADVTTPTIEHGEISGDHVREILSRGDERVLAFNSEKVRGQVKFIYDQNTGEVKSLSFSQGIGNNFSVPEEVRWQSHMENNWQNSLGLRSQMQVQSEAKRYIRLKSILDNSGFGKESSEYKYINGVLKSIINKYGDLIKEETI